MKAIIKNSPTGEIVDVHCRSGRVEYFTNDGREFLHSELEFIRPKVEEFIEQESFVIRNPDYPVTWKKDALKAIEMSREETKQKAIEAFTDVFKEVLGACYQSDIDMFKEKLED